MTRRGSILVIGDLNADVILTGLSGHPRYGREVLVSGCTMTLGGSGAIFACGMARLGRDVRFLGKVGADGTGDFVVGLMRQRGVDVWGVKRDRKRGTGIAVAFTETGDRALVSYLGTVATTTPRDVAPGNLRRHGHLHLTSPFLQLGLRDHFVPLLKKAKLAGLTTSMDPGWDPRERWDLDAIYPWLDVLMVNELEAKALTGVSRPASAAKALSEKVVLAVVKAGPKGAFAATKNADWSASSYEVDPVDTTGAGDSFDAGFIDGWLQGHRVQEVLAYACACGALSTAKPGGYDGQPTRAEALRLVGGHR
ncbi:MAG: sugar kinase [Planctomycetes bacterium]|nr:sugar kinase [Planctomycetota bacterium]